ncbi:hypothetical protein LX15_002840 [Streptoalloteichus tenebrarius]|uniref:Uncharacterized protein n=1 Tax=Streptoalloteichus tenebrarius (strain ATCC 17920 / DSM 40477 / JCM 4838 / CBS 697.72 / NBRC 16177 / NCIMB 11028 / NRRL B-12390 / A12253. 1 / ISP 5477) TaxID=1933 RepID=A0ABT1HUE5_STRSD|nr:hypothetical protein [Streptoalloteichus tenebrarius]MCP2259139.1 hypothetical protein [Streptoalloteichus tenebrarius]BFF04385.1 hypothetical protein GCM10020241_60600 [Streptoalloteichus tenebrarius]
MSDHPTPAGPDPDPDLVFSLLPQYHRQRDAESGGALRALLAVLAEQLNLVEDDIARLYDNWFVETCQDWAVPYVGDLVGYRTLRGYEEAVAHGGEASRGLAARLAPRRDVADTVTNRRRKGTLPLLENLARTVADWPARAVEFHRLLAATQPVRLLPADEASLTRRAGMTRARYVDLRGGADLDLLDSPFDGAAHLPTAARINGARRRGRHGPPSVGVFVWRLLPHSVTRAPAYCVDRARNLYTFSILGNDVPLVTRPVPEPTATHIADVEHVPAFIRRRALADRLADYYGPGKSIEIWRDGEQRPVPLRDIVVADLDDWRYRPRGNQVAVDPVLGRLAFSSRSAPRHGVWVTYHHAFSADMGGGEYTRDRATRRDAAVYRVGPDQPHERITQAYQRWRADQREGRAGDEAVIEITHSGAYQEQIEFVLAQGEHLEVRAAEGARPVIRLLDWYSNRPDALNIRGVHSDRPQKTDEGCRPERAGQVVLDGLLITGRGVNVCGPLSQVVLRHCTLVPGWSLEARCAPLRPEEPSLILEDTSACVQIEHSILGTILVISDEVRADPIPIHVADSVLDATGPDREALSGPDCRHAHAELTILRSTVLGEVHTHAVRLGENSLFTGLLHVARRGVGCLRFCAVPSRSRTPRRYRCQPDGVLADLRERAARGELDPAALPELLKVAEQRVRPRFTSTRYGTPGYAQLADGTAPEIARGAEDGAELGAFHDLYQPQREDNLRARLDEFLPAGMDAGIVHVS